MKLEIKASILESIVYDINFNNVTKGIVYQDDEMMIELYDVSLHINGEYVAVIGIYQGTTIVTTRLLHLGKYPLHKEMYNNDLVYGASKIILRAKQ